MDDMVIYRHKQIGYTVLVIFAIIIIILAAIFAAGSVNGITLTVLAILFATIWIFSSQTVTVTNKELIWHFGPGIWKLRLARENITNVEAVRNKWWWGFGIRITPHGFLYNVHGLDAVEVTTKDGKKRRIGTDDVEGMIEALRG